MCVVIFGASGLGFRVEGRSGGFRIRPVTAKERKCFGCLCLTCIYPPLGAIVLLIAGLIAAAPILKSFVGLLQQP